MGWLSAEMVLGLTCDFCRNGVQPSRQPVSRRRLAPCGCDIERLTVRPAESAGCNVLHRHLYDAINRSVRRDPHNAPSEEPAIPEVTFRIDSRAIGQTPREALKKRTLVRDRPGSRVVVIHPDDVGERVAEIETSLAGLQASVLAIPRSRRHTVTLPSGSRRNSAPSFPPVSRADPSWLTLLRMDPIQSEPLGSGRASFRRTLGHPSRRKSGLCRTSVLGSHKITPEPRTTTRTSD